MKGNDTFRIFLLS